MFVGSLAALQSGLASASNTAYAGQIVGVRSWCAPPHEAELQEVFIGERNVIFEVDGMKVYRYLHVKSSRSQIFTLFSRIYKVLHRDWRILIRYEDQDSNIVIDRFVKLERFDSLEYRVFLNPPLEILHCLSLDLQDIVQVGPK
ncbi:hypothetical protein V6N11_043043 [Hibiscus sabdariffa]|uniref:Uncharacterized protein n=1 Tax=Hibiscus sabdariffa TaxID=183260 RepID=A0ABR2QYV0_9ROSI